MDTKLIGLAVLGFGAYYVMSQYMDAGGSLPVDDTLADPNIFPAYGSAYTNTQTDPVDNTSEVILTTDTNPNASWKTGAYPQYAVAIRNAEIGQNMPTDLLSRLLYQESSYNPAIINGTIKSNAGALGIAQFMPSTASEFGINPLDPFQAIPAAARYLSQLKRKFGNWVDAVGAYNAGPGNYAKFLAGTRALKPETIKYVADITADVNIG